MSDHAASAEQTGITPAGSSKQPRRVVCGWCPMQLPDNHDDWHLHFMIEHGTLGFSVRMYQAQTIEEELATITQDGQT